MVLSIHRNSKAYWGWGEGVEVGEEEDKLFTWNKAKKMPCSWEKIHSCQLHHTELSKIWWC